MEIRVFCCGLKSWKDDCFQTFFGRQTYSWGFLARLRGAWCNSTTTWSHENQDFYSRMLRWQNRLAIMRASAHPDHNFLSNMKECLSLLMLAVIAVILFTSCVTHQRPPAANDWSTEYAGSGPVRTSITNDSGSSLFLKVRSDGSTAAQVKLKENGTRDVFLSPSGYDTVMMFSAEIKPSYYRGPGFDIPFNAAHMSLTLEPANSTNLTPISREEFER